MPNLRVKDLVQAEDLPPAKQAQQFVTFYVNHRDLKLAACQAKLDPDMGPKLYRVPKIRKMIDSKILLIDVENAKLKAQADRLTVDRLDSALVEEVDSKKNGHIRVRAIELGYRRTGLIRDGEFVGVNKGAGGLNPAKTYGQIHTTTVRETTTKELIQSSEVQQPIPPQPFIRAELMNVQDY